MTQLVFPFFDTWKQQQSSRQEMMGRQKSKLQPRDEDQLAVYLGEDL